MALGTELALAFVIIGVLMLLAEAASPGAFIIVPATVLLVLGGVGLIYPDWLLTWWAPLAAVIVLVPMTLVTMKIYQNLAPPAPPETTVGTSLVGQMGVVVSDVHPHSLRGKVRIQHDTWSATSRTTMIPAGTRVVVTASEGVHVTVEEAPGEAAAGT
ncbi:MAG: NfeD family protein [Methanobacteriota archaeon]|nr:MAG: NfeD family protein [Euryarchaeota archaeon]